VSDDEIKRSTPQWLLASFPGFISEWRDHVYSEPEFARLKQGMRLKVNESAWRVEASVSHRRGRLGLGVRLLPHYRVTAGAILGMHDLFMSLCSRPDFFAELPGANEEPATHPHHKRFRDYSELRGDGESPAVHAQPADETRYLLALLLMTAGFHWLVYHEESHFLAGHLLYVEQMHAQESISEVEVCLEDSEKAADLRALELHADERAHIQIVRTYANGPNVLLHPVEEMRTPADGVRVAIVAIGCVLLLFEANRAGPGESHPMPMTRLLGAFGLVFTTLARRDPAVYGRDCNEWIHDAMMQRVMDQAIIDLQAAAKLLGLPGDVGDIVRPLFEVGLPGSVYIDELRAVNARLTQMRPALSMFREHIGRALPRARLDNW
jgi:hypothetical protein